MKKTKFFWLAAACLFAPVLPAAEPASWTAGCRNGEIQIDGKLDEAAWRDALWGGSFTLHGSFDLGTKETEAAFLWDAQGLYIGVRAWDTDLAPGSTGSTVRDLGLFNNDRIELFLKQGDAYRQYVVNSLGTQYDSLGTEPSADWRWESACAVADGNRREYEVFIPWESAGIDGKYGAEFQFIIARYAKSSDELYVWNPWFGGFHHAPERFPKMVLGENLSANLKVDPVALRGAPAKFAFAETSECAADGYELAVLSEDGAESALGSHAMTDAVEIPGELPAGNYFLQFSIFRNGEIVYTQQIPRTVEGPAPEPPEVRPFFAELVQPWFENETEIVLEYANNGWFETAEWRIADADGQVLDSGSVALDEAGRIIFPMPEANGDYKLLIEAGSESLQLDFTKADPVGEPRQWFAVGEDGALLKDGTERFFPLIYFALVNEDIPAAGQLGADFVISGADHWHLTQGPDPVVVERNLTWLDRGQGNDMPIALMICNDFRNGADDYASLRYAVARMKNHPYLAAWYLADEPALYATDPAVLEKAAAIIHEIDPIHPVVGCEVKPKTFKKYQGAFDMFGIDPYPGFPGGDLAKVDEFIVAMQRDVDPDKFQFVILQGFGQPFNDEHPKRDESFNMMLQVLSSGADGICWWMLEVMRKEFDGYREMAEILAELKPLLDAGEVETIRQGSVMIGIRPGMIIAVNKSRAPAKAVLPFEPGTEIWKQGGEVSLNGVNLQLGPIAGCIWLLEDAE